jgi:hypothetical protein
MPGRDSVTRSATHVSLILSQLELEAMIEFQYTSKD